MSQVTRDNLTIAKVGEPVYEIAELFPEQGSWSEERYLALETSRLVEFNDGLIEVLPLPTKDHQLIVLFIYDLLKAFVSAQRLGGKVLVAPYRLRILARKYREPDVLYLTAEQNALANQQFADKMELIVEVLSADNPERDLIDKRRDYAVSGVAEYWIVDPERQEVLVLQLEKESFVEHGRFSAGQQVTSRRFAGLTVSVQDIFNVCL